MRRSESSGGLSLHSRAGRPERIEGIATDGGALFLSRALPGYFQFNPTICPVDLFHRTWDVLGNVAKLSARGMDLNRTSATPASFEILPFSSPDLDALYIIDQECFPPGISYSRAELSRFVHHRQSKTWVARSQDRIVGFLIFGCEPQKTGHIVTIDVIESMRGAGAGTALMTTTEAWAVRRGLRLIYLETAEDNRSAQIFYSARGYVKVEEIAHYYSNGQTAWVMVKWL